MTQEQPTNRSVIIGTPHSGFFWVIFKQIDKENWQEISRVNIVKGTEDPQAELMERGEPGNYRVELRSPENKIQNSFQFKVEDKKQKEKAVAEAENPLKELQKDLHEAINVQNMIKTWKECMPQSEEINTLKEERRQMIDTIKDLSEKLTSNQQHVESASQKVMEQQLQEERRKNERLASESSNNMASTFQIMMQQQQLMMQQQQNFLQVMLQQSQRDKEESFKFYTMLMQQQKQNSNEKPLGVLETALPAMLTSVTDLMSTSVKKILEEQEGNDLFIARLSRVQNCLQSLAPVVVTNIVKLISALKGGNGGNEDVENDNQIQQLLDNLKSLGIGPNEIKQIFAHASNQKTNAGSTPAQPNPPVHKDPPKPSAPLIIDLPAISVKETPIEHPDASDADHQEAESAEEIKE